MQTLRCPHCGGAVGVHLSAASAGGWLSDEVTWAPPGRSAHFRERLTSWEFSVKALAGQAALGVVCGSSLAGLGVGLVAWPWWSLAVAGVACGGLVAFGVGLDNRRLLHQAVESAGQGRRKQRQELQLGIMREDERGHKFGLRFLYVPGVEEAQLREFARQAVAGRSLAVHSWVGAGRLFARPQFDALMSELELAGLVRSGCGNQARSLAPAGKSLLRRWLAS